MDIAFARKRYPNLFNTTSTVLRTTSSALMGLCVLSSPFSQRLFFTFLPAFYWGYKYYWWFFCWRFFLLKFSVLLGDFVGKFSGWNFLYSWVKLRACIFTYSIHIGLIVFHTGFCSCGLVSSSSYDYFPVNYYWLILGPVFSKTFSSKVIPG